MYRICYFTKLVESSNRHSDSFNHVCRKMRWRLTIFSLLRSADHFLPNKELLKFLHHHTRSFDRQLSNLPKSLHICSLILAVITTHPEKEWILHWTMTVDGGKSANEQLIEDQALKNQDCWGMFVDNQNQCYFSFMTKSLHGLLTGNFLASNCYCESFDKINRKLTGLLFLKISSCRNKSYIFIF